MRIQRKGNEPVLERLEQEGTEYLTFPALSQTGMVSHLFSTRLGGVSEGDLSTMNLSYSRGDRKENVDENFRRIAKVLGRSIEDIVCSDQTHTTNVRRITLQDRGKGVVRSKDYTDVDGMITNEPGIVLATFYADCVPLYFVDPVRGAIGLAHSGWRGTAGKIGAVTVQKMTEEYGTNPADVIAAIGPSICQDCYEVSEDVAEAFRVVFEGDRMQEKLGKHLTEQVLFAKGDGKYQLNLWQANALILQEAGIPENQISVTDLCTCCNPEYLFSHRASHGRRGNLGAFLTLLTTEEKEKRN
ncbi:MAG: peptidoglycan editing factor PgeF [Lachnospiraceae bacterium]|nr:peptidoglycan editing factor PgeF [Lachnospiraceae bacterium]